MVFGKGAEAMIADCGEGVPSASPETCMDLVRA